MKSEKYILKIFAGLIIVIVAVFGLNAQCYALEFMALQTFPNFLYRVDTSTIGSPEFIGVIGAGSGSDLSELVTAGPDTLYTLDRRANTLWKISTNDLSNPVIVPLDRDVTTSPRGMDISPAGTLYGVFGMGRFGMQLFAIAPATGTTTLIASITNAYGVEAIAFAPNGTLYAAGSPTSFHPSYNLYTLNISTGELLMVGEILVNGNLVSDIDTLTFASDGFLYGADAVANQTADLIRIDPATALATVVGNNGVTGLNGLMEYISARTVAIDIKPGSVKNPINLKQQGVIPVAILTTDEFDAATVDPVTAQFAGALPLRWVVEDIDYDGNLDLVFHFDAQEIDIECGDTEAALTGKTFDGIDIIGTDSIRTLGCN